MGFLKKNLIFCIVVTLCVAASIVGVVFALNASGEVKKAERSLTSAEAQLSTLLKADPAPTEDNLEAAERNLAELKTALARIREDLQSGASLDTSADGISVMAGIQQYISKFQKAVARHKDEAGEPDPIKTPNDFAFGFDAYIDEASMLQDAAKVTMLDKQRQILSYLLTQLIAADPESIEAVKREILQSNQDKDQKSKSFSVAPSISARVPGAIDTMGFSLTFSGYTDSLRELLNRLSRFELPIVVRSIKVERPSGSETVVAPASRNDPDNIFSLFEDSGPTAPSTTKEQAAEGPKPVIEENISQFTVILEFIEVVLPEAQTQEVSDPA